MAKELPYFKFEPSQWDNGNIQMCSLQSKGLFIDLCSLYWNRLGEVPYALALQKLCNSNKDALQELIKYEIVGVVKDQIVIDFLDEQLLERGEVSVKRRESALKRWSDANALQLDSKSNARREEENREKKSREKKNPQSAIDVTSFFDLETQKAWADWEQFRKELGKKITPSTAKKQIQFLGGRAGPEIIAIINQSITNGWTGLFELKKQTNGTRNGLKNDIRRADATIQNGTDFGQL